MIGRNLHDAVEAFRLRHDITCQHVQSILISCIAMLGYLHAVTLLFPSLMVHHGALNVLTEKVPVPVKHL